MSFPALRHLLFTYFHEDFDETGGLWGTVDLFAAAEPELAPVVSDEIDTLLKGAPSEHDLDGLFAEWKTSLYLGLEPGGYRGWLEEVARRLRL